MSRPDTKYVAIGDADVAYQVLGEAPADLLFFIGLGSHVEMAWEDPDIADFLRRLASLRRLILLDRRGTGASDGVPRHAIPTWEEWTEDIEGVLDAVGSEHATILATVDAGPIAILYAAAHPERVDALVLCNTSARYLIADDYPIGVTPEALDFVVEFLRTHWGTAEFLSLAGGAGSRDPVRRDALARLVRSSVTPRTAAAQYDYLLRNLDVRPVLPLLRVPTLVLSADNPSFLPMAHGRYVAEHIEGSKFVVLPGDDMLIFSQRNLIFDEVAEFLTGTRPIMDIDRVLVSVLFTDIVGSTERAASLGDQRWRSLLDRHDQIVREQLRIFRGRESTPRETVSSLRSMVRHGPSVVAKRSSMPPNHSTSRCAWVSTPVNARSEATILAASPFTSPLGSVLWHHRTRFLSRAPSRISWLARALSSLAEATTS